MTRTAILKAIDPIATRIAVVAALGLMAVIAHNGVVQNDVHAQEQAVAAHLAREAAANQSRVIALTVAAALTDQSFSDDDASDDELLVARAAARSTTASSSWASRHSSTTRPASRQPPELPIRSRQ